MWRLSRLLILSIVLSPAVQAAIVLPVEPSPGLLCRSAIAMAEREQGLPVHLLAAIGRVESGRQDGAAGAPHPWPWTINAEGQGAFFDTKAQAVAAVRALQARGVRSIDVGCLQVNLLHHPDAFASLEQAFDPGANAGYAARFLRQLQGQAGAWPKAIAQYHSATPELGEPYAAKVMAVWPEENRRSPPDSPLARAWSTTQQTAAHAAGRVGVPFQRPAPGEVRGLDFYRTMPIGLGVRARGGATPRAPVSFRFRG